MTVDDIGGLHVSCVRVRITKKIRKAHGRKRVVIAEGAFVEFDHNLTGDLMARDFSWQMMKLFKSNRQGEARKPRIGCASAGNRPPQTPVCDSNHLQLTNTIEVKHCSQSSPVLCSTDRLPMATISDVSDELGQPPALNALSLAQVSQEPKTKEQIITPFDVSGGVDEHGKAVAIDYDKLIDQFGSQRIDKTILERLERLTGKPPHRLLRRGLVFSHRDLNLILDKYEKGIPFFLYTGRGPSSGSMHVGHSIPFEFTKFVVTLLPCIRETATNRSNGRYLQEAFNVPLIIMLTDDEKFVHTPKLSLKECRHFALENALDIIAIGFDPAKTFIFVDTDFIYGGNGAAFGHNILEIGKKTTNNQIRGTFGFNDTYVVSAA